MNIFYLDHDPAKAAQYHNDKHVVKMILESAQIMSTVCRIKGLDVGYKATHSNHPCTLWAGRNLKNFMWLRDLAKALNEEYKYRYYKLFNHKSWGVIRDLPLPEFDLDLPTITTPALAMPDECKVDCAVQSYRNYYMQHKRELAVWSRRGQPAWWN